MNKIFVWGTGRACAGLLDEWDFFEKVQAFVSNDDNKTVFIYHGVEKKIIRPEELLERSYDAVIVATRSVSDIYEQCRILGMDLSKFIFLYNNRVFCDLNKNYDYFQDILDERLMEIIKNRYHLVEIPNIDEETIKNHQKPLEILNDDYVNEKIFYLCAKEIHEKNIPGQVAELGAFRGDFSKILNKIFKDKISYLFDTFEGYYSQEAEKEVSDQNCGQALLNAYKDAAVEDVIKKLPYPDKAIIKKGFFLESLEGLEDNFSFVSIDVSFEDTTLEGLRYFYPRLNEGGYIFLHGYNSRFKGVSRALNTYETENNIHICKVPICDRSGSIILTRCIR